jgi:flavin-binding protein dodecin
MAESVYKVIELVGTSTESWEKAAQAAVKRAAETLRDLRIAEISQLDMQIRGRFHSSTKVANRLAHRLRER